MSILGNFLCHRKTEKVHVISVFMARRRCRSEKLEKNLVVQEARLVKSAFLGREEKTEDP